MRREETFPAFAQLKQEMRGLDLVIEVSPAILARIIEYVNEVDYRERKAEILETRSDVRERYREGKLRIEETYGTVVVRTLERREDLEEPRFDSTRIETELLDAESALDELYESLDEDYLIAAERRQLSEIRGDIDLALEYARNKRHFDETRERLEGMIASFDDRFEPYADHDRYMRTGDERFLSERSTEVYNELVVLAREVILSILPHPDARWLGEQKSRFSDYVDLIPIYNEQFVRQRRDDASAIFETEYGPLNDQQQKAIVRNDRRNLVDASAGTGKTLTLTKRFVYLVEYGVPYYRIRAITFTTDAADEMKGRIASSIYGVSESQLNVSTIHSFAREICYDQLESNGSISPGTELSGLIDDWMNAAATGHSSARAAVDKPSHFESFYEEFLAFRSVDHEEGFIDEQRWEEISWRDYVQEQFLDFAENARTFRLTGEDIRSQLSIDDPLQYNFASAGSRIVDAYNELVDEQIEPLDFAEMINRATQIIKEDPDKFAREYGHLLVDEFQDVSPDDVEFIESLMLADSINLFCVGDDWQSIFGFRGSDPSLFMEYENRFDEVTYTPLEVNYRCPPTVVEAGVEVIAQSEDEQNEKAVRAFNEEPDEPAVQIVDLDPFYENRVIPYTLDLIEDALENYSYDDIMVLSRNDEKSMYLNLLRKELRERNIPHRTAHGRDFLPREYIDSFERDVGFDNGEAYFRDEHGMLLTGEEGPPIIQTQSIHKAKGREAKVVILLHAVDDDRDGIPAEERVERLLQPALSVRSNHVPEERRLFYVALTRAEERFIAVTNHNKQSRFLHDISEYAEIVTPPFHLEGEITNVSPATGKLPHEARLQCNGFNIELMAWPDKTDFVPEEGKVYRIENPHIKRSENFPDQIDYARSTMIEIEDD